MMNTYQSERPDFGEILKRCEEHKESQSELLVN